MNTAEFKVTLNVAPLFVSQTADLLGFLSSLAARILLGTRYGQGVPNEVAVEVVVMTVKHSVG